MTYSVAVIGGGRIADRHLKAIVEMDSLKSIAIADINKEKADSLAVTYGLKSYQHYQNMIEKEKPDIVVIALPHFLHKEVAINAAQHGCHILLEKPMAMNVKECDEIISSCNANDVCVMVCHTQQYMSENNKAKEIIQSGILGDIKIINDKRYVYYFDDQRPNWFFQKEKAGGGIVINIGAHSIDKIQWITGSRVSYVKAALSPQSIKGNIEGSGLAYLELTNQKGKKFPATISLSGFYGVPENETEFICTYGKLKITHQGIFINKCNQDGYQKLEIINKEKPFILQLQDLIYLIENRKQREFYNSYAKSIITAVEAIYCSNDENKEIKIFNTNIYSSTDLR